MITLNLDEPQTLVPLPFALAGVATRPVIHVEE